MAGNNMKNRVCMMLSGESITFQRLPGNSAG
ncbi:hypothetical protein DFO55_1426 [Grimontella sp. AG753]|uniref:Uncharacterized protein n=1 Tax=Phytobacter diazotrophicus TaxID=395631 RepID=A0ABM7W269_9ENTR|nr:hypothetical protein DFO55_1426 [Grimontella sp. AG753]TCW42384.1 hypothetical protein EDC53_12441 [Phytobacter diazotrophicus]BDD53652.1 hypothetical protein PDTA9734_51390 [Phytobacter diazotrophicus]BEG84582.1 hypothetical protein PDTA9730_50380 [Phytobacter diazotrophicus]BEG90483.1 hypothetical protein PDTA9759_51390 [Phytobacter diazotrophicus]